LSEPGANEEEMQFATKVSERELDRILAGKATGGEFEDVATFFQELRISLDTSPSPSVEARHLAGIFEEALHLQPSPPDRQTQARRGTLRLRNPLRRLAAPATIAAVGLAALAAFGGAAYAGALPTPIQTEVAHLARHVGLSLPANNHHSSEHGAGSNRGTSHIGKTGQPDQGNFWQGTGTHANARSNDGQGTGTHGEARSNDGQGNDTHGGGTQGNGSESNAGQGRGTQGGNSGGVEGAQTNGNQEAHPTTVQGAQNEQGTQGAQNNQSTPNGRSGAGGGQQGNGAGNGAGNGN
jgi:hypothetical protein